MLIGNGAMLMVFGLAKSAATIIGGSSPATPTTPSTPTQSIGALALSAAPDPVAKHGMAAVHIGGVGGTLMRPFQASTPAQAFYGGCNPYLCPVRIFFDARYSSAAQRPSVVAMGDLGRHHQPELKLQSSG